MKTPPFSRASSASTSSPPPPTLRRVLLVEDHVVVREALAALLERSGEWAVCGQTDNGRAACELAQSFAPEAILLDFLLAGSDGFELVRTLAALPSKPAVLVLSVIPEVEIGERVMRAGARGFLHKRVNTAVLLHALREVCEGRIVASKETILRFAASRFGFARSADGSSPVECLSNREFEVMCLLGSGLTLSEIGERLGLSSRTVERHRENIMNKLNLQTASEVARWARARFVGHGEI